jgi:nucleotide-binding universal stress UspA family protein
MARLDPLSAVRSFLVPFDGGPASVNALAVACDVAKRGRASVSALYVIEVPLSLPIDADLQRDVDKGEALLREADQIADDHDIRIEGRILQARQAGVAVVDEAAELHSDAIVLGLDYHRPYGRFELGSVSQYVLENARCQVWLIRYPPPAGEAGSGA